MNARPMKEGRTAPGADFLPPDRKPRATRQPAGLRRGEIIDAEFEVVPGSARRRPYPVFNDNRSTAKPGSRTMAAPGGSGPFLRFKRLLQSASPKGFAILVTAMCAPIFVLFAGLSPKAPALVSPPPLLISAVTTAIDDANGMKILSVSGAVENHSDAPKAVRTLSVDIIAGGEKRTVSRISADQSALAPGETRPFATQLLHTGGKLPQVSVSFGPKDDSAP